MRVSAKAAYRQLERAHDLHEGHACMLCCRSLKVLRKLEVNARTALIDDVRGGL